MTLRLYSYNKKKIKIWNPKKIRPIQVQLTDTSTTYWYIVFHHSFVSRSTKHKMTINLSSAEFNSSLKYMFMVWIFFNNFFFEQMSDEIYMNDWSVSPRPLRLNLPGPGLQPPATGSQVPQGLYTSPLGTTSPISHRQWMFSSNTL